ncbi:hypothetical protein E2C01_066972 [Portunus trituberculatus]|uniref:Uncharacterized protein n=1 Tax=Portunus trituberculatus TaxID=210409 RepID=A0A5B7HJM4_PORTR|nr:hypothetical protein [Portunus trituberculatus]
MSPPWAWGRRVWRPARWVWAAHPPLNIVWSFSVRGGHRFALTCFFNWREPATCSAALGRVVWGDGRVKRGGAGRGGRCGGGGGGGLGVPGNTHHACRGYRRLGASGVGRRGRQAGRRREAPRPPVAGRQAGQSLLVTLCLFSGNGRAVPTIPTFIMNSARCDPLPAADNRKAGRAVRICLIAPEICAEPALAGPGGRTGAACGRVHLQAAEGSPAHRRLPRPAQVSLGDKGHLSGDLSVNSSGETLMHIPPPRRQPDPPAAVFRGTQDMTGRDSGGEGRGGAAAAKGVCRPAAPRPADHKMTIRGCPSHLHPHAYHIRRGEVTVALGWAR